MDFKTAIEELQKLEDNPKESSLAWPADMNEGYKAGQSTAYANARTLVSNLKHDVEKRQRQIANDLRTIAGREEPIDPRLLVSLADSLSLPPELEAKQ